MKFTSMVLFATLWLWPQLNAHENSFSAEQDLRVQPFLTWLVPNQPLAKTLAQLAKAQGKNPDDYVVYRSRTCGSWPMLDDQVRVVTSTKTRYEAVGIFGIEQSVTSLVAKEKTYAVGLGFCTYFTGL